MSTCACTASTNASPSTGSGSSPAGTRRRPFPAFASLFVSLPLFLLRNWEAACAFSVTSCFPSSSAGATSAYALRSAPAAAEEAVAFATEISLASSDAAPPIPRKEIALTSARRLLDSSAPCPCDLFLGFIWDQPHRKVFGWRRSCRLFLRLMVYCQSGGVARRARRHTRSLRVVMHAEAEDRAVH